MKKILSAIFFFGWMRIARAQGAPQAILEQIAALKGYIATAEEGSKIVGKGLSDIQYFRNTEFEEHKAFFNSFVIVNPGIQEIPPILKMMDRVESSIIQLNSAMTRWQTSPWLLAVEIGRTRYCSDILEKFIVKNLRLLHTLVANDGYKMMDGERLKLIEDLVKIFKDLDGTIAILINNYDRLVFERKEYYISNNFVKNMYNLP